MTPRPENRLSLVSLHTSGTPCWSTGATHLGGASNCARALYRAGAAYVARTANCARTSDGLARLRNRGALHRARASDGLARRSESPHFSAIFATDIYSIVISLHIFASVLYHIIGKISTRAKHFHIQLLPMLQVVISWDLIDKHNWRRYDCPTILPIPLSVHNFTL